MLERSRRGEDRAITEGCSRRSTRARSCTRARRRARPTCLRKRQRPARQPPGTHDDQLGGNRAVEEAAGQGVNGDPGVDVRLHAVGEGAVIGDRQRDEHGHDPDSAMNVGRPRTGGACTREPAVHPRGQSELQSGQRQYARRQPGLERQGVCRRPPEQGRARVVGNVLGAEGVKGRRDDQSGAEGKQEPGARFREARCAHPFTVADALRRQARLGLKRGGRSSVGRAPGCGPGGRGFESRRSPL